MKLLLLLGVALVARAQTVTEPNYEGFLSNLRFPLQNYRPILNLVQVQTLPSEQEGTVSVRSLMFPARETECSSAQDQTTPCPLKENGKVMMCNVKVNFAGHEVADITTFDMKCVKATQDIFTRKVRRRRGKSGKSGKSGGSRGRGRAGRGSSIAGRGKDNGTRTA